MNLVFDDRQEILETIDLKKRLLKICTLLKKEVEILEIEGRIRGRIQTQVEKNQREYYLTEQIKAIHKELGREDQQSELTQLRDKIKDLGPSKEAMEKVDKEIKRLEQMPPLSSEAVVSRHYIDWISSLPWSKSTKDRISLTKAEDILNAHHAGLKKPKERIIEFLAAKKFSTELDRSPIICLVGPPGVGKTSLGKSVARALGREFVRISLGGVKDEAEIRGHRRTYVGALPGRIIQGLKQAGTNNPVFVLDEIDKLGNDFRGDPAAALLEVLDPEQNNTFRDHYLNLNFDLSNVMFLATANTLDTIPAPLRDRMEIIQLPGYTQEEKSRIAKKYLIKKQISENGIQDKHVDWTEEGIQYIIEGYTREAGLRNLERLIGTMCRKTAKRVAEGNEERVIIDKACVTKFLGPAAFSREEEQEKFP